VPELESAWLFKIAHNVCLSRRRSSWRRGKVEAPNNFEVLQEIIPGREQVSDELIRLQDVLEEMPENQRRAILLREWQGLTYREISAELGLTQAAVETLIFRARRALAQGLEQDADTWKKRLRRGADVGGAIAFVKALLGGGGAAAVKVATALAVAATTVATATEAPRHAHHAQATKPAPVATRHLTRQSTPTSVAAKTGSLDHRTSTRTARPAGSSERSLLKPVVLPVSHPDETSAPALAQPTSAAEAPPAPAPVASAASVSEPADNGQGNGKPDKADRTTQSTTLVTEVTPVPVADPPAQDSDQGRGNGNDKDKADKGNGNDNGNNAGGNSNGDDDNPGKGSGKDK
jgi:hypothetical protein